MIDFNKIANLDDRLDTNFSNVSNPIKNGYSGITSIPDYKIIEFYYPNSESGTLQNISWRNALSTTEKSKIVNQNILLIPENAVLKVSGGIKYGTYSDGLQKITQGLESAAETGQLISKAFEGLNESKKSGAGILEMLQDAAISMEETTVKKTVVEYEPIIFDNLEPIKISDDFKFNFYYGSAGLYNAFEEVVKPIIALIRFFAPIATTTNGGAATINMPWDSNSVFMFNRVASMITNKDANLDNLTKGTASENGLAKNAATLLKNFNEAVQGQIGSGAKDELKDAPGAINMSWGRYLFKYLKYGKYNYTFDMEHLDENGYPISGSFTVSGIESTRKSTYGGMVSPIIQGEDPFDESTTSSEGESGENEK